MAPPKDRNGNEVSIGSRVKLLDLSGEWFDNLPSDEKEDVTSMIGEIFQIEEIDEYGRPWIRKSWHNDEKEECNSHSISLDDHEMELQNSSAL